MDAERPGSPPRSRHLPPLRLYHLFAATAVTAVTLAVMKLCLGESRYAGVWLTGFTPAYVVIYSLALYCVCLGYFWRRGGRDFPSEPGHGILIAYSVGFFVYLCNLLLFDSYSSGTSYEWPALSGVLLRLFSWLVMEWGYVGLLIFFVFLDLWCARKLADSKSWILYFRLAAVGHAMLLFLILVFQKLFYLFGSYPSASSAVWIYQGTVYGVQLAITIVLAMVVNRDRLRGVVRHWTHWFGVGSSFLVMALSLMHLIKEAVHPTDWSQY